MPKSSWNNYGVPWYAPKDTPAIRGGPNDYVQAELTDEQKAGKAFWMQERQKWRDSIRTRFQHGTPFVMLELETIPVRVGFKETIDLGKTYKTPIYAMVTIGYLWRGRFLSMRQTGTTWTVFVQHLAGPRPPQALKYRKGRLGLGQFFSGSRAGLSLTVLQ